VTSATVYRHRGSLYCGPCAGLVRRDWDAYVSLPASDVPGKRCDTCEALLGPIPAADVDVDDAKLMQALTDVALNAACAALQERLGITDGGLADLFFQGDNYIVFGDIITDYVKAERHNALALADGQLAGLPEVPSTPDEAQTMFLISDPYEVCIEPVALQRPLRRVPTVVPDTEPGHSSPAASTRRRRAAAKDGEA
jgi:hypothetical protein